MKIDKGTYYYISITSWLMFCGFIFRQPLRNISLGGTNKCSLIYFLVLNTVFGPKRDEVTGEWRQLHNGELHNLYSSPDIIRQIKSRRMRWAGHVARMGQERKVEIRNHWKDQDIEGRMRFEWILGRSAGSGVCVCVCGVDSPGSR
jgi:hypothetical protein